MRLLLVAAEGDDDRPDQVEIHPHQFWRIGAVHFFLEQEITNHVPAGAAMLDGPLRRHPALLVDGLVPVNGLLPADTLAQHHFAARALGQRRLAKGAHFAAKGDFFRGKVQIHFSIPFCFTVPTGFTAPGHPWQRRCAVLRWCRHKWLRRGRGNSLARQWHSTPGR